MAVTGPADMRDGAWLLEQLGRVADGIDAVILIAANWTDGRQVGRLHPGMSAAAYVRSQIGPLRLGKAEIIVLLNETNWSNSQIAAVAGVSDRTVAANLNIRRG